MLKSLSLYELLIEGKEKKVYINSKNSVSCSSLVMFLEKKNGSLYNHLSLQHDFSVVYFLNLACFTHELLRSWDPRVINLKEEVNT